MIWAVLNIEGHRYLQNAKDSRYHLWYTFRHNEKNVNTELMLSTQKLNTILLGFWCHSLVAVSHSPARSLINHLTTTLYRKKNKNNLRYGPMTLCTHPWLSDAPVLCCHSGSSNTLVLSCPHPSSWMHACHRSHPLPGSQHNDFQLLKSQANWNKGNGTDQLRVPWLKGNLSFAYSPLAYTELHHKLQNHNWGTNHSLQGYVSYYLLWLTSDNCASFTEDRYIQF